MLKLRAPLALIALGLLAACGESDSGSAEVVRRKGEPDFVRSFDEKEMGIDWSKYRFLKQ